MIKTEKYQRKPFVIDAVQVTEDNLTEVAEWCGGDVRTQGDGTKYIKVKVHSPKSLRQTMAFAGDWVLFAEVGTSYKVYTEKAFANSFESVFQDEKILTPDELLRREAGSV